MGPVVDNICTRVGEMYVDVQGIRDVLCDDQLWELDFFIYKRDF